MANDLRLNFTNIGAHERVASGGFVGGSRYQKKAESGTPSPPSSGTPPASVTDDPMDGSGQKTPRRRRRSRRRRSRCRRRRPSRRRRRRRRSSRTRTMRAATRADDGVSAQSVPPPLVTTGSVRDNPFLRRDSKARLDAQSAAVVGGGPAGAVRLASFGSAVLRSASFLVEMANDDDDDDDLNPDAPQPPTLVGGGRSSSGASNHRNLAAGARARPAPGRSRRCRSRLAAGFAAMPMPTTAHMRGVKGAVARERGNLLASTRQLYSGRSAGAVPALADRQGSDDALLALPAPEGDELLASIIPGEPAVRVPSRKRQLCAQGHRLLRALPLWTLNG